MDNIIEKLWISDDKYKDKLILGPMVRASSLPLRLLCLEYGF